MRRLAAVAAAGLTVATHAIAAYTAAAPDPAVSDVDPRAVSLRRSLFGRAGEVTRPGDPNAKAPTGWVPLDNNDPVTRFHDRRFRFDGHGFRAYTNEPTYLVGTGPDGRTPALDQHPSVDGRVVPMIPADTVFDLTPAHMQRALRERQATITALGTPGTPGTPRTLGTVPGLNPASPIDRPPANLILPRPIDGRVDAPPPPRPAGLPTDTPAWDFARVPHRRGANLNTRAFPETPVEIILRAEARRRSIQTPQREPSRR